MIKSEIKKTLKDSGLFDCSGCGGIGWYKNEHRAVTCYCKGKFKLPNADQSEKVLSDIGLQVIKTKINSMELELYVLAWVGKPMMVHKDPDELCAIKIADAFLTVLNDGQGITQAQHEVIAELTNHPEWLKKMKETFTQQSA